MTENKFVSEFKYDRGEVNGQNCENNKIARENSINKKYSKKEKKIQNLKNLRRILDNNKNENLESLENKNFYKENNRLHLNTEAQELNVNKNNKVSQDNDEKSYTKFVLGVNKEKTELMKINDLENLSRLLKRKIDLQKKSKCFKIKKFFEKILDNNIYVIFMMCITIFILFISDIQNGWLDQTVDWPIDILQTIIFGLYFLEIIITSMCKDGYIFSFFFWLDILSTIYIIQDIGFIINPILGFDKNDLYVTQNQNDQDDQALLDNNFKLIDGMKTAFSKLTAASRATRILRLIKIVRLIRMVKLYKAALLAKKNFELHKSKKKNFKKYARINAHIKNASNIKINQSSDFPKANQNEHVNNNRTQHFHAHNNISSRRNSVMNMNNVQIIEFENNVNNTNCQLKSPRIYKIINADNNSIESFSKYNNDINTNLQTDANVGEISKEKENRALEPNKIEVVKKQKRNLLNGKSNNNHTEKCLDRPRKHNLCLLENLQNNNNNISLEKTPRSNKEFLNSDLEKNNHVSSHKDNIPKQNECENIDLEKNTKTCLRYSNTHTENYNLKIIFAENNQDLEAKITKNYTVRENQDSPIKLLNLRNRLQINGGNIFLRDSNNVSLNSYLEEHKNTYSVNVLQKDKANSCKNIIEVNNSNISSNNNINKSYNNQYAHIPINGNKIKILLNKNDSCKSRKNSSLKSKKENILTQKIDSNNNNYLETNINNEENKIHQKVSFNNVLDNQDKNKRENEIGLLFKNQDKSYNNLQLPDYVMNKRNLDLKGDVQIDNLLTESKTRILLTESITKKVILLILSLVIFLPILSEDVYRPDSVNSYAILANYISNYRAIMPERYIRIIPQFIVNEVDDNYPIINITDSSGLTIYRNESLQNYSFRYSEIDSAFSPEGNIVILFSVLHENQYSALLSIIRTFFVCVCLLIATVYFEKDTKKLVLDPLEIMIEIVEMVSKDPIKAKDLDNFNIGAKSTFLQIQFFDEKKLKKFEKQKEKSEVKTIQSAIKKIAALLAIGLGEAGSEIIKENLSNYNDLNPMIKGRKKKAIFGFCDIRDFPLVNEALQENTVVFLNQIADIVHSSVDLFFGATNKNIGDAFLTVWKLPNRNQSNLNLNLNGSKVESNVNIIKENRIGKLKRIESEVEKNSSQQKDLAVNSISNRKIMIEKKNNANKHYKKKHFENNGLYNIENIDIANKQNLQIQDNESFVQEERKENKKINLFEKEITNTADCSVLAFLSIIIKINRDLRILSYRSNSQIRKQIQNYKVTMGFGLHMGWAIEGAIGSNYKIDASYLSPNVNMAARLEAATRQYGVKILISGKIYELLSEELKVFCRIIDIVTVKGSLEPIKLYTVDLNEDGLKPYKKERKDFSDKGKREKQILIKNAMKTSLEESNLTKLILKKKHFKRLLKDARPIEFYVAFNSAFKYYVEGEWKKAKGFFLKCMLIYENDGPVNTLYDFIKSFEFVSPVDWRGYRSLTSK